MLVSQSLLFSVFCIWFGCAQVLCNQSKSILKLNECYYSTLFSTLNYWELLDCCQLLVYMINKFSFTIFHWQGFLVHVDDQLVSLEKFRLLKISNILATFFLLSVYTSKFLTWQFFLVKEKLARQVFLDKEICPLFPSTRAIFTCQGKLVKEKLLM